MFCEEGNALSTFAPLEFTYQVLFSSSECKNIFVSRKTPQSNFNIWIWWNGHHVFGMLAACDIACTVQM